MPRPYKCKRGLDIVLSLILLAMATPLFVLAIILTLIDGHLNPFFLQKRVGLDGKRFTIFKFKTMKTRSPSNTIKHFFPDTLELTTIGRFLRNTALDELPQLLNVLNGDMSIIGPRPHAVRFAEHYASFDPRYDERHSIKPGLLCIVEVTALHYRVIKACDVRARGKCDLYYARHCSFGLDLKIFSKAIKVVISSWFDVLKAGMSCNAADKTSQKKQPIQATFKRTDMPHSRAV